MKCCFKEWDTNIKLKKNNKREGIGGKWEGEETTKKKKEIDGIKENGKWENNDMRKSTGQGKSGGNKCCERIKGKGKTNLVEKWI